MTDAEMSKRLEAMERMITDAQASGDPARLDAALDNGLVTVREIREQVEREWMPPHLRALYDQRRGEVS